ncbi:hypothetical protein Taro_047004 [Colocasia esculenta]|uniref:Uncharacterized protein n=1 Tax=Colocasia esculenta TaxID=4460 RepID=A0A843X678_COLES|nr:hypothetical protein [Colocasia esculenta]
MASGGATLFLCALVFLVSAARPARSCLEIFQASCTKPDAEPKDWVHCGGHLFRCDSYRMEIKFGGKDPTYMARKDPLDDLMLEMEDPVLSPIFADTDCDFLCSFSDSLPLFAPLPAPTPQRSSLLRSHCDKSNYSNLVSELIVGYQQYRPCSTYYLYFKSQRQHEYEEYPRLRATHRLSEPAATSPLLTWKLSMEYNTNSTMFNIVSVGFSRRGHQLDATSHGGMERIAIIVGLIFFGAYLTCGMLSGGWIWRKCEVDMKDCDQEQLLLREIGKNGAATYTFVDVNKGGGKRGPEICVYSFSNVLAGTDNFSDDKKLGQGGFGAVYKVKPSL